MQSSSNMCRESVLFFLGAHGNVSDNSSSRIVIVGEAKGIGMIAKDLDEEKRDPHRL